MQEKYEDAVSKARKYAEREDSPAVIWLGDAHSVALKYLIEEKIEQSFEFIVPKFGVGFSNLEGLSNNDLEEVDVSGAKSSEEAMDQVISKTSQEELLFSTQTDFLKRKELIDPFSSWNEKHLWAFIKREFIDYPDLYDSERVDLGGFDIAQMLDKVLDAKKVMKDVEQKDAIFLWTGGKEAQIIADLLLNHIGKEELEVPFGVIDTGNQFEEMYSFRSNYLEDKNVEFISEKFETFLEHIVENPSDPRGYHGEHSGTWKCPECGSEANLDKEVYEIHCSVCGAESKLEQIQRQNLEPEEWGVPESCGALKVEPLKRFVEDHSFNTMITGRRGSDAIVETDAEGELQKEEKVENPVKHKRVNPLADWTLSDVWAYILLNNVPYCSLYDNGYNHTDSKCCTDQADQVGEYGEGGRDAEKEAAKEALQEMGYV